MKFRDLNRRKYSGRLQRSISRFYLEIYPKTNPLSQTFARIRIIAINSKYFPDSDWLKAHT